MFFYMYENMAEFCLLGGDECRTTEPGRNRRQAADTRAANRQAAKESTRTVPPLHPRTGATGCLEGDVSEDVEACEDTQVQQAHGQQRSGRKRPAGSRAGRQARRASSRQEQGRQ